MAQVNTCDLRCPKKTMMALQYRLDTAQSNPLSKLIIGTNLGIRGVGQAGRAAVTCPSRKLPEEQWHASTGCLAAAQQMVDTLSKPVRRSELTEYERDTLSRIRFAEDPPPRA